LSAIVADDACPAAFPVDGGGMKFSSRGKPGLADLVPKQCSALGINSRKPLNQRDKSRRSKRPYFPPRFLVVPEIPQNSSRSPEPNTNFRIEHSKWASGLGWLKAAPDQPTGGFR
jgi:hypothetical protein